jgi:hypothetical protein
LDLGFLVDGEDRGGDGRAHVEAYQVADLFDEVGIGRHLEGALAPGFEPEGPPDLSRWCGSGLIAQRADLRVELAELKESGVPVLALSSDRDRIIPGSAFETVCDSVGASTIDVQVADYQVSRATDRRGEVKRLLKGTHLSKRDIESLLGTAAPLWLLSDEAPALAGDLVLCRPQLRGGEVRALARHIENSTLVRLTIAARDRQGLLADSAAVLTASGMSISSASASTWKGQHLALNSFIVGAGHISTTLHGTRSDRDWGAWRQRARRPRRFSNRFAM